MNKSELQKLSNTLKEVLTHISQIDSELSNAHKWVHPHHRRSAANLIRYTNFRQLDLRPVQNLLSSLGLTRFANSEGNIRESIQNSRRILKALMDGNFPESEQLAQAQTYAKQQLELNSSELLGRPTGDRRVRIMVTLSEEVGRDYERVLSLVRLGMNCARINCAHDSPEVWQEMVHNLRRAEKEEGVHLRIAMDLAGPKIRTGNIQPGPKIKKFVPQRDERGMVIGPARIVLLRSEMLPGDLNEIPLSPNSVLGTLSEGDVLEFSDARNKHRKARVVSVSEERIELNLYKTCYLETNTVLYGYNLDSTTLIIGDIEPIEGSIPLRDGDLLRVVRKELLGMPAIFDQRGILVRKAQIPCQSDWVFEQISIGEPVLLDDGKIEGMIVEKDRDYFEVRITKSRNGAAKLRSEKGMSFPESRLQGRGLTEKDREDLSFVVAHADVVHVSFVNSVEDVEEVLGLMRVHNVLNSLGLVLKIETQLAYDNLEAMLLRGMQAKKLGVMIARGDLAVETGWTEIGWVQEEILSMCSAAHVPVIWATQVLENLAKKGIPSRSEITDAVMGLKAECVMLNKGAHIEGAVELLDDLLSRMEFMHRKRERMLPKMKSFASRQSKLPVPEAPEEELEGDLG